MNYTKEEFLKALLEERKKTGKKPEIKNFYGCSIDGIAFTPENIKSALFEEHFLKGTKTFGFAVMAFLSSDDDEEEYQHKLLSIMNHGGPYIHILEDLYILFMESKRRKRRVKYE